MKSLRENGVVKVAKFRWGQGNCAGCLDYESAQSLEAQLKLGKLRWPHVGMNKRSVFRDERLIVHWSVVLVKW